MCGIVGLASKQEAVSAQILTAMIDRLRHRGPDDRGQWSSPDNRVGLGHTRLAIIDLSSAGHQPIQDGSGKLWLTFNGEIYNFQELRQELEQHGHRFHSNTDSEVVLHAYRQWGDDCVQRFNGMFAFGLYDVERHRIFLARDRVGKKPLYYHHGDSQFAFASEAKALLPLRNTNWPLDPQAVNFYFTFGYVPGEMCIFKDVHKLLPGNTLIYDLWSGECAVRPYWAPPLPDSPSVGAAEHRSETLLAELETLLEDSVRLRLIADVPLGVLLSGGVDSSLVTALAARVSSRRVKTFTVTFPGAGHYDEGPYARLVADHFGTEHHELAMPSPDLDILRTVAWHLDEPLADPSIVPSFLVSRLTREHVTVALGGDGGDELFGGYAWYRRGLRVNRLLARMPGAVRRMAASLAGTLPVGRKGRNLVRALADDLCHYMISGYSDFDTALRRRLFPAAVRRELGDRLSAPEEYKRSLWLPHADAVLSMSVLDFRTFLQDDILFKVDRASMAYALEVRAPWLDHRIVEFALTRVPSALKVTIQGNRFLQRKLAKRLLPPSLDLDRKQGFVFPIHAWMAGEWGDVVLKLTRRYAVREWINPDLVRGLLNGQRRGLSNGNRLFSCLMFGLWLEGLQAGRVNSEQRSDIGER
jgi:asparagine synthase (glutamine-hydrolysing)